jgi:hypothetical protein
MNIWNRPDRIAEIYGTLIAAALTVFFFLMYAIGIVHVVELRLFNILIMLVGVYYALKQYRRTHGGHLNYFRALAVGVSASAIGVSTFALILFIFLKIDTSFMRSIIENEPFGQYLNAYVAAAAVMIEGVSSGFFVTYILLNWIYTDRVSDPV